MLRFWLSPFMAGEDVNGPKPLYGSIAGNTFKLWENSWFWSGESFTYVHGVLSPHGSGVRLLLRPRRSPVLKVLGLLPWLAVASFYWSLRDDFAEMNTLGQLVVPLVGVMIGFCFWLPIGLVHRFRGRELIRFLQEELALEEVTSIE